MSLDTFSLDVLIATVGIAVAHTAMGPDHYLPFIMLARVRGWSRTRTAAITAACGVGHVASSILLGLVGVAAGVALARVEAFEGVRGGIAAWLLVGFGLAYLVWGTRRALRQQRDLALHAHDGAVHVHAHGSHAHGHDHRVTADTTFWTLFIVFVLGPCEPLIPLFMLPAARGRWGLAALTGGLFGVVTIAIMVALVLLGTEGLRRLPLGGLERWAHAMAGAVIAASGLAMIFLGL